MGVTDGVVSQGMNRGFSRGEVFRAHGRELGEMNRESGRVTGDGRGIGVLSWGGAALGAHDTAGGRRMVPWGWLGLGHIVHREVCLF